MSPQALIFRSRADEARTDADKAVLANVRDHCLRSAAAWDDMADRALRTERMRVRQAADKEASRLATAGEQAPPALPALQPTD
jgi:hypothetical protein